MWLGIINIVVQNDPCSQIKDQKQFRFNIECANYTSYIDY